MTLRGRWRRRRYRRLLRSHGFALTAEQPMIDWQEDWRRGSTHVLLSTLSNGEVEAVLSKRGRLYGYVYKTQELSRLVAFR